MKLNTRCAALLALAPAMAAAQTIDPSSNASVTRSGTTVYIEGKITNETELALRRLLNNAKGEPVTSISVNSASAEADAVLQVGRLIRSFKLKLVVNQKCASLCANYLAPAARSIQSHSGDFLVFTEMFSPKLIAEATTTLKNSAASPAARNMAQATITAGRKLIASQDVYFLEMGVKPARIYAMLDLIALVRKVSTESGRPVAALVPDNEYLHKCLGVTLPKVADYNIDDSRLFAHTKASPIAFIKDSAVYYEGLKLVTLEGDCI